MKKILLLGATGDLGQVLAKELLDKNYTIRALIRNLQRFQIENNKLEIIEGKVTDEKELEHALKGVDAVISVLGHGFRTNFPIQKKVFEQLVPMMEKNKIDRLITVTGSGLNVAEDNPTFIDIIEERVLGMIDPYRLKDAKVQQEILEKSNLNWTVVRTPIHSDSEDESLKNIGYKKSKIWNKVGRIAIAKFMIENIQSKKWVKKSPIIY